MCEVQILLKSKRPEKAKAKKIVTTLKKGIKEIKAPKLETLLTEKTKELIKEAELILSSLEKKVGLEHKPTQDAIKEATRLAKAQTMKFF